MRTTLLSGAMIGAILAGGTALAQDQKPSKGVVRRVTEGDKPVQIEIGSDRVPLKVLQRHPNGEYLSYGFDRPFADHHDPNGLGADLTQADYSLRAPLNLPNDRGLVVTNVAPHGRAARVGLQENDILLTLDDRPLDTPKDLTAALKAALGRNGGADAEKPLALTLLRKGKTTTIKIRPEMSVTMAAVTEEKPEFFIGVPVTPVDATLRSQLDLPGGAELIAGDIAEDTPAARAGLVKGDILLSLDGVPLPGIETLRARVQATEGKPAQIKVFRKGNVMAITVTPERRMPDKPESTAADPHFLNRYYQRMFGNGMIEIHTGREISQGAPIVNRLLLNNGQPLTLGEPIDLGRPVSPDLARKIDDLTAQVQALTKAVEELRRPAKPEGEPK